MKGIDETKEKKEELKNHSSLKSDFLIHLKTDLLLMQDTIMVDRHHDSGDKYKANDAFNKVGGILLPFSLTGWLRHGMEQVLIQKGQTVCHPAESTANLKMKDVYERDLENGYHKKGDCADNGKPCLIFELYGGFKSIPSKFIKKPIRFSPIRSTLDFTQGQAEAHYRRIVRQITSRNIEDNRIPFRSMEMDALANFDGTWKLTFREIKPEYIGLLNESIEFLNEQNENFMHQLGGGKNNGAGIMHVELINPMYDEADISNYFDRNKSKRTEAMKKKDITWEETLQMCKNELNKFITGT